MYYSRLSQESKLLDALNELCEQAIFVRNSSTPPDLCFVFVSPHHRDGFRNVASVVSDVLSPRCLLGCSGETIVGDDQEIESGPAVSLWCADLPGAQLEPFHAVFEQTPDGILCTGIPDVFPQAAATGSNANQAVFCLGQPFSTVPRSLLDRLNDVLPAVPVMGGMASGGNDPSETAIWLNNRWCAEGTAGVVISGGPPIRSIVSQGCRPIGEPFVITKADRNIVWELGGVPTLTRIQQMIPTLPDRDRQLIAGGMHLGLAMNEYRENFRRGDFLISNVMGADESTGAIVVENLVRAGQTCQLHVRDADTADEDLTQFLAEDAATHSPGPRAALLFSCNGRGTRLFPDPHHDARAIQTQLGPLPLAGFFAQGELGPIDGQNYIHGFTASIALFD